MIIKRSATAILLLVTSALAFSVSGKDDPPKPDPVKLRAEAERMIRQAAATAPSLSSTANRVNLYLKLAELAWDIDDRLTWSVLAAAGEDVKRYITDVDIETNRVQNAPPSVSGRRRRPSGLRARTNIAFALRKSYVGVLATYAPEQARAFVFETNQMFTNDRLRTLAERTGRSLESLIVKKIAENDVGKAIELGKEKLKVGISSEVASILNNVYRKDKAKGAEFGESIVDKLKSSAVEPEGLWIISRIFRMGLAHESDAVPLFDPEAMKEISSAISDAVLSPSSKFTSLPQNVLDGLERYNPGSKSRIQTAFDQRKALRASRNDSSLRISTGSKEEDAALEAARKVQRASARAEVNDLRKDLARLMGIVSNPLTGPEDRGEAISMARDEIFSVDDDRFRYTNLAGLAVRAYKAGEEDEALSLMKEAEAFVKSSPKERSDFSASLEVASAYAEIDPQRAFSIYEEMAYGLNSVIEGYVRFAEYSGNGRTVAKGELLMNQYARQFTRYFEFPKNVVIGLASANSGRLVDLADRFDRPEVRAETRLMIAESLLKALE